jgi:hypothetical protein
MFVPSVLPTALNSDCILFSSSLYQTCERYVCELSLLRIAYYHFKRLILIMIVIVQSEYEGS